MPSISDQLETLWGRFRGIFWVTYFLAAFGYLITWNYAWGNTGEHPPLFGRISLFGLFVASGILLFVDEAHVWARRLSLDWEIGYNLILCMIIAGGIGSHVLDILLYEPAEWRKLFDLAAWRGNYSSLGGIFSAITAGIIYLKRKKVSIIRYADMTVLAFTACWIFGRMGCFSAHDHLGEKTGFFLGLPLVENGQLIRRHELGLYEVLFTIVLFFALRFSLRKPKFDGFVATVAAISYAVVRFFFDFLRMYDGETPETRYVGLTPAQWFCFGLFALGVWVFMKKRNSSPARA